MLVELRARHHGAAAMRKIFQQAVLAARDRFILAGLRDAAGGRVDHDVAERDHRSGRAMVTTHEGAETGEQLLLHERLRDVIIGAEIETGHAIVDRVPGGEHHHRCTLGMAKPAEHLTSIHDRHEVIEDDGVVVALHRLMEAFLAVDGSVGGVAFLAEQLQEAVTQRGFVFYDKDAHRVLALYSTLTALNPRLRNAPAYSALMNRPREIAA